MKINLNDPNPPVKFHFEEDNPDVGFVLLRRMNASEAQRIRKLCSQKQAPVFHRGQMYDPPEKVDDERQATLHWDYVIAGWEGLQDGNGDDIPCTTEMKRKLILESPQFLGFITEKIEKLELLNKDYRDESLKN